MNRRIAVIEFDRSIMRYNGGMEKHLFRAMIQALPNDARIAGFREDLSMDMCGILVYSDTFPETKAGHLYPKINAVFSKHDNGAPFFERLEFPQGLKNDF